MSEGERGLLSGLRPFLTNTHTVPEEAMQGTTTRGDVKGWNAETRPAIGRAGGIYRSLPAVALSVVTSLFWQPRPALAMAGDLDLSFGSSGTVITNFTGTGLFERGEYISSVALQSDGKIVTAGYALGQFALARYNEDGSLDSSFGTEGKVTTSFFNVGVNVLAGAFASAVMIQPDGRIVAAGTAQRADQIQDFAVARYQANGTLDPAFGSGGKVTMGLAAGTDVTASCAALQADGKVIVGGSGYNGSQPNFALARFDADGSPDLKFNGGQIILTDFPGLGTQFGSSLVVQPDGSILMVGGTFFDLVGPAALARYTPDGTLDPTFGDGGRVATSLSNGINLSAAVLRADGKIVVVGNGGTFMTGLQLLLLQYNRDGSLDTTFGSGGVARLPLPFSVGYATALQPDGKILAAGARQVSGSTRHFLLARFDSDGLLDPTFGAGGIVANTAFLGTEFARAIVLQPDGRVILAGSTTDESLPFNSYFALARYKGDVSGPDFGLIADPLHLEIKRGHKGSIGITTVRSDGFEGAVNVTPSDTAGVGVRLSQVSGSPKAAEWTFRARVKGKAQPGSYPITFSGQDDSGRIRITTVTIVVR
jgi:uncharacterized delta-60 repeat protein